MATDSDPATVAAEGDAARAARLMRAGGYDVLSRRFMADSVIAAGDAGALAKLCQETGARLHHPAVVQHDDGIGHGEQRFLLIVGDHDRGYFQAALEHAVSWACK